MPTVVSHCSKLFHLAPIPGRTVPYLLGGGGGGWQLTKLTGPATELGWLSGSNQLN